MRAAVLTLLAAAVAAAQEPPAKEPSAAGLITNGRTGEPLRKAFVTLQRVGHPPALEVTTVEGKFRFDDLPAGDYNLSVQRAGFAARSLRAALPDKTLKIALDPLAAIHGRVTDEDGDPLPGVQVRVLRPETLYGTSFLALVKTVQAAPDGAYRADELLPGRYYLQAASQSQSVDAATVKRVVQQAFYPGVATPGQATPIEAVAGVTIDASDLRLPWRAAYTIAGRLELPGKMKGDVRLYPELGAFVMEWNYRSVPLNGETFELKNVPEGDYVLRAIAGDDDGLQARLRLAVAADIPNVRVRVERVPSVQMVVRRGEADCHAPGWILFPRQPGSIPVGVSDKKPARVLLGDYRPVTDGAGPCYVAAMRYNGQPVTQGITVAGDGTWQVEMSAETGGLEGVLVTGESSAAGVGRLVPGATAIVIPEADEARLPLYQSAQADAKGRFVFPNLAPGIYRVLGDREWQEPNELDMLAQLRERGTRIRVEQGERRQVIVRMD